MKEPYGYDCPRCGLAIPCHESLCDACKVDVRREEADERAATEQRGSRCTPGCGWCGACS